MTFRRRVSTIYRKELIDILRDRRTLLTAVDRFRRDTDQSGVMEGVDNYTQQAMSILTSSGLANALDLSHEDPRTGGAQVGASFIAAMKCSLASSRRPSLESVLPR